MSWNFKKVGTKEAVKEAVQKESNCPQSLRDALCSVADPIPVFPEGGVFLIESDGHVDTTNGGYGKFSVTQAKLST